MLRKLLKVTSAASLGLLAVVLAYGGATGAEDKDKDEKLPTIGEIMKKGHKGTDAYMAKIKTAAKDGSWDDATKYAKTLAFFGTALGKNKAPKGDADSWDKLSKQYADNTKAVLKGTEDKDVDAVNKALGSIQKSCGECHKAHKP